GRVNGCAVQGSGELLHNRGAAGHDRDLPARARSAVRAQPRGVTRVAEGPAGRRPREAALERAVSQRERRGAGDTVELVQPRARVVGAVAADERSVAFGEGEEVQATAVDLG